MDNADTTQKLLQQHQRQLQQQLLFELQLRIGQQKLENKRQKKIFGNSKSINSTMEEPSLTRFLLKNGPEYAVYWNPAAAVTSNLSGCFVATVVSAFLLKLSLGHLSGSNLLLLLL